MNHSWNLTPTEAIALQKELRVQVDTSPLQTSIRTIGGADVSLQRFGTELFAGIVVLSYPDMRIIDHSVIKVDVTFPYVPGLLSFREIPGLLECYKKLKIKPDVIMVDGQGITHPRRLGIATHFGLAIGVPTLGCAKSKLYGEYDIPKEVDEVQSIIDIKTGEEIGKALKSKERSNPILISPGNKMSVEDALRIAQTCLKGYRLPEPTRQAHLLVNASRKGEID